MRGYKLKCIGIIVFSFRIENNTHANLKLIHGVGCNLSKIYHFNDDTWKVTWDINLYLRINFHNIWNSWGWAVKLMIALSILLCWTRTMLNCTLKNLTGMLKYKICFMFSINVLVKQLQYELIGANIFCTVS